MQLIFACVTFGVGLTASLRRQEARSDSVRPVPSVPGFPHEDPDRVSALLHPLHQTQRLQEAHGEPSLVLKGPLQRLLTCWLLVKQVCCVSCLTETCAYGSCATPAWWRPSGSGRPATRSGTPSASSWTATASSWGPSSVTPKLWVGPCWNSPLDPFRILIQDHVCAVKQESQETCCESICKRVLAGEGDWKTGKTKIFLKVNL